VTFSYKPATFECATLMFGIAGPTSSGKTMSALRLATGLSPDKPIFLIDTEQSRSLLYAKRFKFQHVQMSEPFSPARYKEAIEFCVAHGAGAIIVDSMSHEHEGVGGVLEMQEQELNRMAGDDYGRREAMKFSAWIRPKAEHNRMLNSVVQKRAHMIFCFRAKDKLELVKKQNSRSKWVMEPVSVGWTPICTDRFEYEMTAMLVLPPGSKGAPDLTARSTKLNDDLAAIFHDSEQISEEHGKRLRAWANEGSKMDTLASSFEGGANASRRDEINDAVPLGGRYDGVAKAYATSQASPTEPEHPLDDVSDAIQWLRTLGRLLREATSEPEVVELAGHSSVVDTLKQDAPTPPKIRKNINDLIQDAYDRVRVPDDGSSASEYPIDQLVDAGKFPA
jgi:AAA domain